VPTRKNRLSQFWQELKRRKVIHVITVYAGAAFVIIELINNITGPLSLPDWTPTLIIILLFIGFPLAAIFSWIYDIRPDEGIVKTGPIDKVKPEDIPKPSNSWKIASYISFVVIVGLILLNIIPRAKSNRKVLEKSIAVLPLEYLSEDPNKEYLANGMLDAITGYLSMIEGLRVMPRTSVEQYRENRKSAKDIGEELDVSYLVEGSFLMIEDQVKLTIQLVVAQEGDHVFFKEYNRNYKDIIVVQSEVAQTIAKEIEVAITPEEKKRIEKVPTGNLTAYDYYQRGYEKLWSWWVDQDSFALAQAEVLFNRALAYDSTYAKAYAGLAWINWDKLGYWEVYYSDNYLDSVLLYADIALSFDNQLAEALEVKGSYYNAIGKIDQAIEEFEKAIKSNPNFWEAYEDLGGLYLAQEKYYLGLENLYQASILHRGKYLPELFMGIALAYRYSGFEEESKVYRIEKLKLDGDTAWYLRNLSYTGRFTGNYSEAIRTLEDVYATDSSDIMVLNDLGYYQMISGQYEQSLKYYKKYIERLKASGDTSIFDNHRIGWVFWQNGYKEEAESFFNEMIKSSNKLKLERPVSRNYYTYYDLAGVYAFRGEKDKAYEHLRIFNQKQGMPKWMVILIKDDPMFDSIREEPEFQQIVHDVEAKYQAEHERVRKWMKENDML